jgi:hypothetical protein
VKNEDISLLLGEQRGILDYIRDMVEKLDHTVNGNSKPGIVQDLRDLKRCFDSHVEEANAAKTALKTANEEIKAEKKASKEKWDNRTWALVAVVIGAFLTQGVGIVILLIRTSTP